jgi:7-keto-8-aminopelargonate synthetase-like enzyme
LRKVRALDLNEDHGDDLRRRLASLVSRFRCHLSKAGLAATDGLLPVQTLAGVQGIDLPTPHERLLRDGMRTVLHHARHSEGARMNFMITAGHQPNEIDRAVSVLVSKLHRRP